MFNGVWHYYAIMVGAVLVGLAINYGFALAGEPRAHWIWCDLLGLCE